MRVLANQSHRRLAGTTFGDVVVVVVWRISGWFDSISHGEPQGMDSGSSQREHCTCFVQANTFSFHDSQYHTRKKRNYQASRNHVELRIPQTWVSLVHYPALLANREQPGQSSCCEWPNDNGRWRSWALKSIENLKLLLGSCVIQCHKMNTLLLCPVNLGAQFLLPWEKWCLAQFVHLNQQRGCSLLFTSEFLAQVRKQICWLQHSVIVSVAGCKTLMSESLARSSAGLGCCH